MYSLVKTFTVEDIKIGARENWIKFRNASHPYAISFTIYCRVSTGMTETQPRSEESSTTDIGTEQSDTVWAFPECLATIPRDVTCCPNCRFVPPLRLG
jgi:hypothetical protein